MDTCVSAIKMTWSTGDDLELCVCIIESLRWSGSATLVNKYMVMLVKLPASPGVWSLC